MRKMFPFGDIIMVLANEKQDLLGWYWSGHRYADYKSNGRFCGINFVITKNWCMCSMCHRVSGLLSLLAMHQSVPWTHARYTYSSEYWYSYTILPTATNQIGTCTISFATRNVKCNNPYIVFLYALYSKNLWSVVAMLLKNLNTG